MLSHRRAERLAKQKKANLESSKTPVDTSQIQQAEETKSGDTDPGGPEVSDTIMLDDVGLS